MAKQPKFARVKFAIEKGLAKLRKWYMSIDQSDIYFICLGMLSLLHYTISTLTQLYSFGSIHQTRIYSTTLGVRIL